jgi:hypothetical protein
MPTDKVTAKIELGAKARGGSNRSASRCRRLPLPEPAFGRSWHSLLHWLIFDL